MFHKWVSIADFLNFSPGKETKPPTPQPQIKTQANKILLYLLKLRTKPRGTGGRVNRHPLSHSYAPPWPSL